MATRKPRKVSSERENWYKLFNASVQVIKTQKNQLQFLVEERKFFEEMIQLQSQRRQNEVDLFQSQILQMKRRLAIQEMSLKVASGEADSLLGLTKKDVSSLKYMLENADSELAAFRQWFDELLEMSKLTSMIGNDKDRDNQLKALGSAVKKLKCENEKLSLEKKTEVSALLAEKKFIWNQYDKMENMFKEKLQEKSAELEIANQKIQMLLKNVKELQSSNSEKDNALIGLKRDLSKLESDSAKKSEEISKLSEEVKLSKGSSRDSTTPLVRCTSGRGKNSASVTVTKKSLKNEKVTSSKRRKTQAMTISDSPPKLFTSSFKVPKLKGDCTRSAM